MALPIEFSQKMDMGGPADPHACKISMLWNWYTIDSCFLANTWHVRSKGMFAGSCLGIFFWVLAYLWFHRIVIEYDRAIVEYKLAKYNQQHAGACCCCNPNEMSSDSVEKGVSSSGESVNNNNDNSNFSPSDTPVQQFFKPVVEVLQHKWLAQHPTDDGEGGVQIYPSAVEHFTKSLLYMMEWACSFLIMLIWMYYNGYVIITCILGYFFGQLLFNYAPLTVVSNTKYVPPKEEKTEC
ncbi:DEKNAAC102573 [Brettanomyces naardenensis]|uniref:Copper transport protein n=1 Tax=Brettanomyces naardenensis TaxID=13370 RepID=A0A448YK18_BRENA|nr:DEKNAAC102573 [Brettanomyces naardenensis]